MLRAEGVVGCFVECFGEGLESLNATQRACISNMTPEYGATCTLFPVDQKTLDYLELTGRSAEQIALVESYAKAQGFWNDPQSEPRTYSKVLELDLSKLLARLVRTTALIWSMLKIALASCVAIVRLIAARRFRLMYWAKATK